MQVRKQLVNIGRLAVPDQNESIKLSESSAEAQVREALSKSTIVANLNGVLERLTINICLDPLEALKINKMPNRVFEIHIRQRMMHDEKEFGKGVRQVIEAFATYHTLEYMVTVFVDVYIYSNNEYYASVSIEEDSFRFINEVESYLLEFIRSTSGTTN